MIPYFPGGPMSCQSAPECTSSSVQPHQCPSMQPISAHQCSLISAH
ncbi:unnamed protein product, partial [Staurois parvus]